MSAVTAVPLRPLAPLSVLKLWLALAVLVLAGAGLAWWGTGPMQRTALASGLQYQVVREGEGNLVTDADVAAVHLVGRRENGEVFADTRRSGPLEVTTGNFFPGLGEGLKVMRKGALVRFWVPADLYRGQVPPSLPFGPNETLAFEVQVLEVAPGMAQVQRMQEMQRQLQSVGPPPDAPGAGAPEAGPPPANGAAPVGPR